MMVDELLIAHLTYAVTPFLWYRGILLLICQVIFVQATSERCPGDFTVESVTTLCSPRLQRALWAAWHWSYTVK